jgi:ABC-type transporter Mla MlaB component
MAFPGSNTLAFAISGPLTRGDLPGLCRRVAALLEGSGADLALCELRGVEANAVAVDALARLQVAARRNGCQVRLRDASSELLELIDFMGLTDVLPG